MNFAMARLNVQLSDLIYWCKNTCRRRPGYYSCAIDAVFELFYYEIYPTLKIIDFYGNELFCKMKEICEKREQKFLNEVDNLRDLFWEVAMTYCTSLHPKGTANAEATEILHKLFDCSDSKRLFGEAILSCDSCNYMLKKRRPLSSASSSPNSSDYSPIKGEDEPVSSNFPISESGGKSLEEIKIDDFDDTINTKKTRTI
jgi:hypothetical protein